MMHSSVMRDDDDGAPFLQSSSTTYYDNKPEGDPYHKTKKRSQPQRSIVLLLFTVGFVLGQLCCWVIGAILLVVGTRSVIHGLWYRREWQRALQHALQKRTTMKKATVRSIDERMDVWTEEISYIITLEVATEDCANQPSANSKAIVSSLEDRVARQLVQQQECRIGDTLAVYHLDNNKLLPAYMWQDALRDYMVWNTYVDVGIALIALHIYVLGVLLYAFWIASPLPPNDHQDEEPKWIFRCLFGGMLCLGLVLAPTLMLPYLKQEAHGRQTRRIHLLQNHPLQLLHQVSELDHVRDLLGMVGSCIMPSGAFSNRNVMSTPRQQQRWAFEKRRQHVMLAGVFFWMGVFLLYWTIDMIGVIFAFGMVYSLVHITVALPQWTRYHQTFHDQAARVPATIHLPINNSEWIREDKATPSHDNDNDDAIKHDSDGVLVLYTPSIGQAPVARPMQSSELSAVCQTHRTKKLSPPTINVLVLDGHPWSGCPEEPFLFHKRNQTMQTPSLAMVPLLVFLYLVYSWWILFLVVDDDDDMYSYYYDSYYSFSWWWDVTRALCVLVLGPMMLWSQVVILHRRRLKRTEQRRTFPFFS